MTPSDRLTFFGMALSDRAAFLNMTLSDKLACYTSVGFAVGERKGTLLVQSWPLP